jgi:hypothetical protein
MRFWLKLLLLILVSSLALGLVGAFFGPVGLAMSVLAMSLAAAVFLVASIRAVLFGAPFVPISPEHAELMLDAAELRPGERLADLGSGDGRLLLAAAKRGAVCRGWEINPYLWLVSAWRARQAGLSRLIRVSPRSYWRESVEADVVVLFLISYRMAPMSAKLRRELPSGARVISYGFRLPDWPGEETVHPNIYRYRQPGSGNVTDP